MHVGGGEHGQLQGAQVLKRPVGGDLRGDAAGQGDVVGQEVAGLAHVLALHHVVLGGVDDALGVVGGEGAAVRVEVGDVVAAAVVAVVVDHDGEGIAVGDLLALVGHGGHAAAGRGAVVQHVGEAVAVDHVVVGQVLGAHERAVFVHLDLGGGELQPRAQLLAAHGDLVEPVFVAVEAEHVAQDDLALRNQVFLVAGGQRGRDGQLRRRVVRGIVGGVFAGVVIRAPDLHAVDQVHEGRGRGAQVRRREVARGGADGLEHVLVPGGLLVGLEGGLERLVHGVALHVHGLGLDGEVPVRLVVGHQRLADHGALGIGRDHGHHVARRVGDLGHGVEVLMPGEHQVDGVRLLDQPADEVGLRVRVDAAVAVEHDQVGGLVHLLLVVQVGVDHVREVDALPVGGHVPLGDVGVADAHDGHLHPVIVKDAVGVVAVPGGPVLRFVGVGGGVQVIGHGDPHLVLAPGGGRGQVAQLAVEDVQAVVVFVVAGHEQVIVHHAQRLHGRVLRVGLIEGVVVRQRRALHQVAAVAQEHVFVLCALLFHIGSHARQALSVLARLADVRRVVGGVELSVNVRGAQEEDLDRIPGRLAEGPYRHEQTQNQQDRQQSCASMLHVHDSFFHVWLYVRFKHCTLIIS